MSKTKEANTTEPESNKSEIYTFSSLVVRNAVSSDASNQNTKFFQDLIKQSKSVWDKAGALYLAAETMPFMTLNRNFKKVVAKTTAKIRNFSNTLVDPYPCPILYEHDSGGWGIRPEKAGIVLVSTNKKVDKKGISTDCIFTGQAITNIDAIDRVMSMLDITQSINFMPEAKVCDICQVDWMKEDRCAHIPGDIHTDDKGKETLITQSITPSFAIEISFVTVPAFANAKVHMFEQNSIGSDLHEYVFVNYSPKIMTNGLNLEDNKNVNFKASDTIETSKPEINRSKAKMNEELTKLFVEMNSKIDTMANSIDEFKASVPDKNKSEAKKDLAAPDQNSQQAAKENAEQVDSEKKDTTTDKSFTQPELDTKVKEDFSKEMTNMVKGVSNLINNANELVSSAVEVIKNSKIAITKDPLTETKPEPKEPVENKTDESKKKEEQAMAKAGEPTKSETGKDQPQNEKGKKLALKVSGSIFRQ